MDSNQRASNPSRQEEGAPAPAPAAGAPGAVVPDWAALRELDRQGMLGAVAAFPHQLEEALRLGREAGNLPRPLAGTPRAVLVAGLGGSAIGGDFVAAVLEPEAPVPVVVHRDYGLPGWVGTGDLVFAVSYSGATEETLSAFEEALARGAAVVAVASGGPLLERAAAAEAAGRPVRQVRVPGGLAPRAALGYLMLPVLYLTCAWTGVGDPSAQVEEAIAVLRRQARELEPGGPEGPAHRLARQLLERPVFIYGAGRLGQAAAYRWQCQLNENAKLLAHYHGFPELNHNEIMGWEGVPLDGAAGGTGSGGRDGAPQRPLVVCLQAGPDHPRNRTRMAITAELVDGRAGWVTVAGHGRSRLAQLLSLSYFGDFVSVYAALLRGLDPSAIASIQRLKERLAALPVGAGGTAG
ncbi:bifunctional phosphoglucose/phosphomannose isomerase [Thermaerobacter sp. PB12/4term]|uniref:bifunctional phosphoglucose/phosphomannose isomerase n=1 Tax=Thermaerobacter sp. PB12/4term TaxID=2293838 RepID=UPI000E327EC2|nr:bifunctional phosphoglucose/phosphomannose isomerase [Thermaerobacter sp. PB12/4term]QIA26461.1 bifunctional phosphoglucose/phosphomannose isomerase [Thermaerobacter sp. PB12/4term]